MPQIIFTAQIILALLLIASIIVQQKGAGLGSTFGGEMSFYRTKRGAEKMLFYITIILTVLFIISSLVGLIV